VDKAEREGLIEADAEQQVKLILQVQQLIEQQLGGFGQELATITQAAEQFKPQPPMPPDNSMQIAQMNMQMKGQEMQQRAAIDQGRMQIESQKMQMDQQLEAQKLAAQQQARAEQMQLDMFRQQQESMRTAEEIASRERMNTADNDTAKLLAAAEMATGEKVAVSTGTGLNPNP
jgi:hypothetical protein